MDQEKEPMRQLIEKAGAYSETLYELYKLKAMSGVAEVAASHLTKMTLIMAYAVVLLLLLFGASFWIGEFLDNLGYGFFVVAGSLGFLAMLAHFFQNSLLKNRISMAIMSPFLTDK